MKHENWEQLAEEMISANPFYSHGAAEAKGEPMTFTAVGFSAEHEGFCASRNVTTDAPQSVADYLKAEFGLYFDQILLMKNGDDSPEVVHHWNIGEQYDEQ